jgi:hypothetical protein
MNKVRKGNYYRKKTIDYLRLDGYDVEILEKNQRIYKGGKVYFIKKDLWGADLIAKNEEELIFIQCKTNRAHISAGIKELHKTKWPEFVKLWVVLWEPYDKEPEIIEVENDG